MRIAIVIGILIFLAIMLLGYFHPEYQWGPL